MEAKRHRYSRMCFASAHDKCLGFFELPIQGRVSCDCACHEMIPTLWSDPEVEADE